MPTYEKVEDGRVVERSLAFAGTPHDVQLSAAASTVDSPWHVVDEHGEQVLPDPTPVFAEPSDVDNAADTPPAETPVIEPSEQVNEAEPLDTGTDTNEAADPAVTDEPAESGDHTEE